MVLDGVFATPGSVTITLYDVQARTSQCMGRTVQLDSAVSQP
jgi:hypothetical protein